LLCVAEILLPVHAGEAESSTIPAGENILVIRTPKGLYIRTKKGRIYAVNSQNVRGPSSSVQSVYTADRRRPVLDPHASVVHGGNFTTDVYNRIHHGDRSVWNGEPYSVAGQSSSALSRPGMSSDVSSDSCTVDPMSFLNITTSCDNDVTWNSSTAHHGAASVASDKLNYTASAPRSMLKPRLYETSSNNTTHESVGCLDLPADLLCLDAGSSSDSTLPALTVRQPAVDNDSLDSLMFDNDYIDLSDDCSAYDDNHSSLYSRRFDSTATSSFPGTTAASAAAVVTDTVGVVDSSTGWSELSAMMSSADQ